MVGRRFALLLVALITCIGILWTASASPHWLRRVSPTAVKIDDCPVRAELYFGHRVQDEDQTLAVLHVFGIGDYVLDLGAKQCREAVDYECIRFRGRVWSFEAAGKPVPVETLKTPVGILHFHSSNGHKITVQL